MKRATNLTWLIAAMACVVMIYAVYHYARPTPGAATAIAPTQEVTPAVTSKNESSAPVPRGNVPRVSEQAPATSAPPSDAYGQWQLCHREAARIDRLQRVVAACAAGAADDKKREAFCRQAVDDAQAQIRQIDAELAACPAVPAAVESQYHAALARAAEAGNIDAQVCYISGQFQPGAGASAQAIEQYKVDASIYAQDGLARGDWRVVDLLGAPDNRLAHAGGVVSDVPIGSAFDAYRMNRLLRLGAVADYAERLDLLAAGMEAQLTPDQIEEADAWARRQYGDAFAHAEPLDSEPTACGDVGPAPGVAQ